MLVSLFRSACRPGKGAFLQTMQRLVYSGFPQSTAQAVAYDSRLPERRSNDAALLAVEPEVIVRSFFSSHLQECGYTAPAQFQLPNVDIGSDRQLRLFVSVLMCAFELLLWLVLQDMEFWRSTEIVC